MTLDEIFEYYKELKKTSMSKQTYKTNIGYYENHVMSLLGSRNIAELSYIDYQKFANNLLTVPSSTTGKPLTSKTVKNIFVVLRGLYLLAKKNNWYSGDDVLSYVDLPKFDNRRYFTISTDLQKSYIRAILGFNEPIYKDIFLFLLHGRRLDEVLDLKWEFLDLSEGIFYLPSKRNKSKKNLSFKLTDIQLQVLKRYHAEDMDIQRTIFPMGHVFRNPITGKRYANVRKAWGRLLDRSGLPKIRIHDIRHLVATYMINELQLPIEVVSHTLGHSDIKITQNYVNPKPENAKYAMDSLFDSIKTKKPTQEVPFISSSQGDAFRSYSSDT